MNKPLRQRPLSLSNLRAFAAVAKRLSFSAAAEALHVTQSAISRQIKGLEDELGAALFTRGTRHVDLTPDGIALLRSVEPWLDKLDASVRQIREKRSRRRVSVTTFASFASLWLLPRIAAFQRLRPDIDIRVSTQDNVVDLDDPEQDVALRYCRPERAPPIAIAMFDEWLAPVISRRAWEETRNGGAPTLASAADLAQHTLAEEDDGLTSSEFVSWRYWLTRNGQPGLQPRRWLYLNYTYQQVQTALAGEGIALARIALVTEALARGELVEPFGQTGRLETPYRYWLVPLSTGGGRPEVQEFCAWVAEQAALTRASLAQPALPLP
jgi:LysR family glycine cleavage system transcriptional activator